MRSPESDDLWFNRLGEIRIGSCSLQTVEGYVIREGGISPSGKACLIQVLRRLEMTSETECLARTEVIYAFSS